MKATFALLANITIHNLVRRLSWDIHRKYRTGIEICRLPAHISLKQPFDISALNLLEEYMTELADSIHPLEVNLTGLELIPSTIDGLETGILWLNVRETALLRQHHNRLNHELTSKFGDVSAAFDGPDYHFHMTVAIGRQPIETYQKIFGEFADHWKNLEFTVRELGMFVYDDMEEINAGYITYKILPLGGNSSS